MEEIKVENNGENEKVDENNKNKKSKKKVILVIILLILVIGIILFLVYYFCFKKCNDIDYQKVSYIDSDEFNNKNFVNMINFRLEYC